MKPRARFPDRTRWLLMTDSRSRAGDDVRRGIPFRVLTHPLMGADLRTILSLGTNSGGLSISAASRVLLFLLSAVGRAPAAVAESLLVRLARPSIPPPLFIVGHWRSGTTLLHNMLCNGAFSTITSSSVGTPWNFVLLGNAIRHVLPAILPEDRFVDRMPILPESPQEDESALAAMAPLSMFHGIYFPKRFRELVNAGVFHDGASETARARWLYALLLLHSKVAWISGGKRELIKNPCHTARVPELEQLFPGSQYIHMVRNPYEVFVSMKHFYRRLLDVYALQPHARAPVEDVVLEVYERMMRRAIEGLSSLPDDRHCEVRFEHLVESPCETVRELVGRLGISDEGQLVAGARVYLNDVRDYRPNALAITERECRLVEERCGEFLERWRYQRPEHVSAARRQRRRDQ